MCPQIRIADGLRTQSAERLITTAGAIINGLTGNPSFPWPSVDLKTLQAAVDDLNAALAAQLAAMGTPWRLLSAHFFWIYPSALSSSAISTPPPAAPRTVLCERHTNL
jgi:hypothetical protein